MTAHDLLSQLRQKGVEVKTSGDDRLVIDAPKGTVTEELRSALSANKAELLRILKAEQAANAEADELPELVPTAPPVTTPANESLPNVSEFATPVSEFATFAPEFATPARDRVEAPAMIQDEDATVAASA